MKLVTINWKPDQKEIRTFGKSLLIGFLIIGAVVIFGFDKKILGISLGTIGVVTFILAWTIPKAALLIYYPWMGISLVMGTIVNYLIIAIIFYLIITPIAVWFKVTNRDILNRSPERKRTTAWTVIDIKDNSTLEDYEKQF